ncbi:MAG: hypothetical protein EYC68_13490 [Chloroflexota bacterium]|nr:MAG: hypothetical protein EYC68_13490 [Chloroflexota bacterium]
MSQLNSPSQQEIRRTDKYTGGYLLFVCVRCTIQYVLLPFVLPFFGLRADVAVSISILIDFIALGMITFNVYRLWNTNWRYRYLALSVVMVTILLIFLYNDLRHLLQI